MAKRKHRRARRFREVATRPHRRRRTTIGRGKGKTISIEVKIERAHNDYMARACPKRRGGSEGVRLVLDRCVNGRGGSPTRAVKDALEKLSRKLK